MAKTWYPVIDKKKMFFIRISVISVILLVIGGLFIFKSISNKNLVSENNKGTDSGNSTSIGEITPLKISEVDLDKIKSYKMPFVIDFGSDQCICHVGRWHQFLKHWMRNGKEKLLFSLLMFGNTTQLQMAFHFQLFQRSFSTTGDGTPYVPSESIQNNMEFTMYSDKSTGKHSFTAHQGGITEAQMRQIFAEMGMK